MAITPRKEELAAVIEVLESDEFEDSASMAKALRPALSWEDLGSRFWSKVNLLAPSGCWEWEGARNDNGYGVTCIRGKTSLAHRATLSAETGMALSLKLGALHSCDNPPCVNPAHLRWGTQADNGRDMSERGRGSAGMAKQERCRRGHPMTEDNLYVRPDGGRRCRRCTLDYNKNWRSGRGGQPERD